MSTVFNNLLYLPKRESGFKLVLRTVAKNNSKNNNKLKTLYFITQMLKRTYEFSIESLSKYEVPGLF